MDWSESKDLLKAGYLITLLKKEQLRLQYERILALRYAFHNGKSPLKITKSYKLGTYQETNRENSEEISWRNG